jgi:TolB-like protein/class 3 adenylate cyclase/tetratricopeptide (TPR) repeat protein
MPEARKLAAILAADVVGYSRLMGEDEAGTARAVREHRGAATPIVADLGGRIVKTTGDGLLIEFPSVVAAVECAIAIQKLMTERNAGTPEDRRILYRIGVNLGDVLIEGDDILGDGVNIAARLEGICEPGGAFISGAAFEHVRGRVEAHFLDLGEKDLKNIARPVRVYAIKSGSEGAGSAPSASAPNEQEPPRLSIVVLPFANFGGDPEQEHFVDGVTDSLTTDLSRLSGSFVIGRNTAFTYKDKRVDLKQIGRELNVRYILEGSVQRAGARMRVNVQLIDAESGKHLWAERFDKPVADLFDMQDEIVARLANTLNWQLLAAEARRADRKPNPDSMDLCFQGFAWRNKGVTAGNLAEARRLFERAAALDSANVYAPIGLASVDIQVALSFLTDDRTARLAAAEDALTTALSIAPENALAHLLLGVVQMHTNRASQGVGSCERALDLDRNMAVAHAQIGDGKLLLGQPEETEGHIQEALRLSPRDAHVYLWCMFAGLAKFQLGREEEAVTWLRRSVDANRNYPSARFILAAALARIGRLPEARSEVRAGLAINPTFTIARLRAGGFSDDPDLTAGWERYVDGLRAAGAPEE